MSTIEISRTELLALKKLAIICGALANSLTAEMAAREQRALTSVLVDVCRRAEAADRSSISPQGTEE